MKKRYFTLKNGAFYPRIQSILAFFLGYFWWNYFVRICGRRWGEVFVRDDKVWKVNVGVCFTTCSRCTLATHCCGRPPTSCRAFLLRTLAMGGVSWSSQQTKRTTVTKRPLSVTPVLFNPTHLASVLRRPTLHSAGSRPQTPPPPPPPPKDPKAQK
jgi:hypothetical protein